MGKKKKKSKYTDKGYKTFTKTVSTPTLDEWESKSVEERCSCIDNIVFLLSCGAKLEEVAKSIEVSASTLRRWRDKHKDIRDALSKGYMECGGKAYRELNRIAYDEGVDVGVRVNILNRLYDNSMKRYEALLNKGIEEEDNKVVINFCGVGYEGVENDNK